MLNMLENWLLGQGLTDSSSFIGAQVLLAAGLLLLSFIIGRMMRFFLERVVRRLVEQSRTRWDDALLQHGVINRASRIVPILVLYLGAGLFPSITGWLDKVLLGVMIIALAHTLDAFLNAVNAVYSDYDVARERPIKGYIQVAQIVVYAVAVILAVSTLLDQPPLALLGGLSAMSAVLLLIFRDTLLGFVGGIQLSMNDMVRIGDWIEMPQYGADGSVLEVNVNTVKVQNWDKTITTIPTYALVSESFKNWRGMEESGGRRIKRALKLDMTSVRFLDRDMLDALGKIRLLKPYLETRQAEIREYNRKLGIDEDDLLNGRHLTNLGTFRAYIAAYLQDHPKINTSMTLLVRQLPPGDDGLPLELYAFSSDQEWARYESIQADIFDHLLAILPEFDLRVFQHPSGEDLRSLK